MASQCVTYPRKCNRTDEVFAFNVIVIHQNQDTREVVVRGYVGEVVISCEAEVIARHPRSYERDDFVFDPDHYLPLLEHKMGALDPYRLRGAVFLPPWTLGSEHHFSLSRSSGSIMVVGTPSMSIEDPVVSAPAASCRGMLRSPEETASSSCPLRSPLPYRAAPASAW